MAAQSAQDVLKELENLLQSMQALKAPGANKNKIEAITKICTAKENAQHQVAIADTIFDALKRSASTHKLGIMYIVDTVTRQWIAGGTDWAGGVKKITSTLPHYMTNLITTAPENQKEKISKLIDIWTTCNTFPSGQLKVFKQQLANPPHPTNGTTADQSMQSIAPPHTFSSVQPAQNQQHFQSMVAAPPASNVGSHQLLAALGSMPQQQQLAQLAQIQAVSGIQPAPQYSSGQNGQQVSPAMPAVPFAFPANVAPASQTPPIPLIGNVTAAPANANALANLLAFAMSQGGVPPAGAQSGQSPMLQQILQNLKPEQIAGVLAAFTGGYNPAQVPPTSVVPPPPPSYGQGFGLLQPQNGPTPVQVGLVQPGNTQADVEALAGPRDRSPEFGQRRRPPSPPDRRGSPSYAAYDPSTANNEYSRAAEYDRRGGRGKGRGTRNDRSEHRRTPPHMQRNRPVSPKAAGRTSAPNPKPVDFDPSLEGGNIKVLSRTLFIGGVRTSENELRQFFSRFGPVQSCIVNHEKRHAFLKTYSHRDCITTKAAVENISPEAYRGLFERVGWAVGFGPTDYADYTNGTSILPINVLTDADRKWVLNAEFGGTGGRPLQSGMVIEEPDIEIGAGPSSKAISRRGGAAQGQRGGGGFNQNRRGNFRHEPYRKPERPEPRQPPQPSGMPEPNTIGPPPPVPTFGTPIPGLPMNFR